LQYIITFDKNILDEYKQYYFKIHPNRKKFPIKSPIHPSINEWFIMKRPQMNQYKQHWKDFTMWVVKKLGYENLNIDKATVTYKYYFDNHRRQDVDNRICKFVNDGLIESKVFVDDCYQHINPMILWGGYDKDNPRMEIIIETIE
jgi:hypothetical protein